ncbi:MAG: enoyl-CoA hydratase/isomerase family protein [Deltaproteobacteria bacterium]|nr:enoyl-CoA hydratase/isomerase family protein [Deltaproteobacteria bacterium]
MNAVNNIRLEKQGNIRIVTVDHPPANTWDLVTMEGLEQTVDELEKDPEARVVILTGAGEKCFSAGFDVKDADNAPRIGAKARKLWTRIDRFERPVIAAINGHALGGGLELALSCHFRIMADVLSARLGLTELNLGIMPGWGGTQRLPRVVGRAKALDMILFSKTLSPREALEVGLVTRLSRPGKLMDDALEMARSLAQRPPIAVACVLRAMALGEYEGIDKGLQAEDEGTTRVRDSQDRVEGFKAFLEKRKPVFTGR